MVKRRFPAHDDPTMTAESPEQHDDGAADAGSAVTVADSAADTAEARANTEADHRGRRVLSAGSLFAIALAFFAAAAAGFLWWQYRQFYVELDRADGEAAVALRDVRADMRRLEDRIGEVGEQRAALDRELQQLEERVAAYPARFADLDEKIAVAQGVSADARGRWLRAQAEYYLGVANAELTLRASPANAITGLELADQALLDSGNPAYAPVRQRIAGELQALRAVRMPDVEGLSYSLSQLTARVGDLPMRAAGRDGDDVSAPENDAEPGLGRLWQSFKNALSSMFRVERREATTTVSLSRNQQTLVRRQLELELTLARLGIVQAMPEAAAASLARARSLLEDYFDVEQPAVEGAIALLEGMAQLEVAPRLPDISGSLALLRDLADRNG